MAPHIGKNATLTMHSPLSWDRVFMGIAETVALRSKDPSTQCGAVLVSESKVVLSTGFNGPPPDIVDSKVPWNERPQKYAFIIHAEENALWYAMESHGAERVRRSTLYCTHNPCSNCILRLIRAGIRRVKIPKNHPPYPMSKYQVEPSEIIERQALPCIEIELI